jgi:putative flippase GtrA
VSFYLVGVLGLAVSLFLLLLFVEWLSYDKQIAKIISIIVVALIQYLLNKHLTFSDLLFHAEDSNINNKNKND